MVTGIRAAGGSACSSPARVVNRVACPVVAQASRAVADIVLRTAFFATVALADTAHAGLLVNGETPPTE